MAGYLAPMFNALLVSLLAAAPEWQPTVDAVVPMYRQLHHA